ncbi:restriction endonuclease subunit S [Brevibacillus ruminantium]|uniref:Restriction endonuclease subunit S n=1 Tax=Brevibacillus ruminantium TaxID=2950604 RepID=A0ABY4WHC7_9BACL|nr:restriction endonuclease subunit S [Brevibacillus ruminantium]USG66104.1 restriction endonuclease subunit S [Brevibacillus ruminantium]
MSKWEMVKLGDVCTINPPKRMTLNLYESLNEVSFVPMSDVSEDGQIFTGNKVSYSEVSSGYSYFIEDDILFAKITPCMENGKGAIARGLINGLGVGSTEFHILRPNKNLVISEWIYRILSHSKLRESAEKNMTGSAGQKRVPKSFLENVLIPLPPLETQKQIAKTLDTATELLAMRKRQLAELDSLIKSNFYEMFGDPVTNEKGWDVSKVEKVCLKIMGGGTPSKSNPEYYIGDIPWVTPKDMKSTWVSDSIDHITADAISNSSAKLIPKNSVLMVIRSGILKRLLPVAINKVDVAINQDMKAFITNKYVVPEYLLFFFILMQNNILKNVRAVTADNIEFNLIKKQIIPLPPIEYQNQFVNIVIKIEEQKNLVKKALDETQHLFDSLMSQYFD